MIRLFNRKGSMDSDLLMRRKRMLARAITQYLDTCDPYAYCTDGEDHDTEEEFLDSITDDTMSDLVAGNYDYVIANLSEWCPEQGDDPGLFESYDRIMRELLSLKAIDVKGGAKASKNIKRRRNR